MSADLRTDDQPSDATHTTIGSTWTLVSSNSRETLAVEAQKSQHQLDMRVSPLGCTDCDSSRVKTPTPVSILHVSQGNSVTVGVRSSQRYDSCKIIHCCQTLTIVSMETAYTAAALLAIIVALGTILKAVTVVKSTTLMVAWVWSMAAVVFWWITLFWSVFYPGAEEHYELMWYSVALLSLCPSIAVLGARRPGAAAWTWFVILPMLAVLGWPMLTLVGIELKPGSFQLELPQLIGFSLVLVMGAGNYVGTRYWQSACLYAVAICLIVAPLSTLAPAELSPRLTRTLGSLALGTASLIPRYLPRQEQFSPPLDHVWNDFRDLFGLVWSRRIQERINAVVQQQGLPVEMTPFGIHWNESLSKETRTAAELKLEQILRWHLRRFVDPDWVDVRMRGSSPPTA